MSHKERAETIKVELLDLSDSLGVSETTLWDLADDETIGDAVQLCSRISEEDEVELTLEQGSHLLDLIIKYDDVRNLANYLEGE